MNSKINGFVAPTLLLAGLLFLPGITPLRQSSTRLIVTPFSQGGIYRLNEKAGWNISLPDGSTPASGEYKFTLKKNNFEIIKSGTLDLANGKATIEAELPEPATLYLQITSPPIKETEGSSTFTTGGNRPVTQVFGAAIAPRALKPVVGRPPDFDAFWKTKISELVAVPENAVITPGDSGRPDVDFAIIKMDHVNGGHVYGQIAKPKGKAKMPAILMLQWASPPYPLQKSWITGYAAQGFLVLDIEPHDVLPDQPQAYYNALPATLKNYTAIGQDDRDKSYFLKMYLADYRAADYLAHRPDWDGKTLIVLGTSMGGQQSLCVAGLHPKITHVIVNEPSGCDLNAGLHGRQQGYPNFPLNNPKTVQAAQYFDAINFAPRIRATSLVAMGFVDTVAPPAGIWTAFNLIRGRKEAAPMFDSPHNNTATPAQQHPFTGRSAEWLDTIVKGKRLELKPNRFP